MSSDELTTEEVCETLNQEIIKKEAEKARETELAEVAEKAAFEARFNELVEAGVMTVSIPEGSDETVYTLVQTFDNKEEAVKTADILERIPDFDRFNRMLFTRGMVDGITHYRKLIAKKGLVHSHCLSLGDKLLEKIAKAPQ